jgi:hypothetical protein
MSRYWDDETAFWRRMVVVYHHPEFREMDPVEALQALHEREWRCD